MTTRLKLDKPITGTGAVFSTDGFVPGGDFVFQILGVSALSATLQIKNGATFETYPDTKATLTGTVSLSVHGVQKDDVFNVNVVSYTGATAVVRIRPAAEDVRNVVNF